MDLFYSLLVFLHIFGAAALLGGWLANFKTPMVGFWQHAGAWIQLTTGVLLVGVAEMTAGDDGSGINHMKIGAKLVVLLAIIVSAVIGRRKTKREGSAPVGLAHSVGGLTLVNVALAVFW